MMTSECCMNTDTVGFHTATKKASANLSWNGAKGANGDPMEPDPINKVAFLPCPQQRALQRLGRVNRDLGDFVEDLQ